MRKHEVEIGSTYSAKISNRMTTVRIDCEHSNGGWDATNLDTGRCVRIKTAAKLRRPVSSRKPKLVDKIQSSTQSSVPNHVIVNALAGTGKEQPVNCLVQTPDGPVRIGDLSVGDTIFAVDGTIQTVDGVYPQGIKDVYRVTFRDGSFTRCGLEHLWTVNNAGNRGNQNKTLTTREMIEAGTVMNCGLYRYRIPLCDPVEYPTKEFAIPPYLLGLLIGDGSLTTNSTTLSFDQQDTVWQGVIPLLESLSLKTSIRNTSENGIQTTLVPMGKSFPNAKSWISSEIKRLELNVYSGEKFVPQEYLTADSNQRMSLLMGLMDSDGSCRKNRTTFSTTSIQLMYDVKTLVQSLGGTAIEQQLDTRKESECYTLNIKMFRCPFLHSEKKRSQWKPSKKNPPSRYITSIKKMKRQSEMVCIKVSSKNNLYLTDEFIVTHNTTTIIEGLKLIKGMEPSIIPSPQQQAIWDEMTKSQGVSSVVFCCFNKSIQQELEKRVPVGCEAVTMHSMGYKAVQSAFGKIRPDAWRTSNIICEILGMEFRDVRKKKLEVLNGVSDLVSLCKQNLVNAEDASELSRLAGHYGIELNGNSTEVFDLVPQVMERSKDVDRDRSIHFDDMIWLPVALGLHVPKSDLLLVDEAQDLNRCQQALARKAGKRLVLVGDPKQAIYGFAGADAESMPRMFEELSQTEAGCVELPLTVTRRCGKAIVEEARKLVPNFEAHESNGDGSIVYANMKSDGSDEERLYSQMASDGDMVLCRVNAPLVSECFKFLRQGRKATIRGRDIGKGLIQTVQKLSKSGSSWSDSDRYLNITDFVERLSLWNAGEVDKENAKKNPSEQRLMALSDKYETIVCFTEEASTVGDLIDKIEAIFSDKDTTGIQFSSIHKAKGLEANRVFILMPKDAPIPHPMAKTPWAVDQEWNLKYVAITRAIQELVFVS